MAKKKEIEIPVKRVRTKTDDFVDRLIEDAHFEVSSLNDEQVEDEVEEFVAELKKDIEAHDEGQVRLNFAKFVQLVALHDFDYIMERHDDESVVISTDLLVDLANAPSEDVVESRFSWVLLGAVIGVMFAAIFFLFFIN